MATPLPPKRILVVDDNRDAADLTAQLLSLHGHEAAVAYDGNEGIQIALGFIPDVVLLDLGMPVVDGFTVATMLRRVPALDRALLVAYTAWHDAATRAQVMASGFDQHVVKPASMDDLLRVIGSADSNQPQA